MYADTFGVLVISRKGNDVGSDNKWECEKRQSRRQYVLSMFLKRTPSVRESAALQANQSDCKHASALFCRSYHYTSIDSRCLSLGR